MIISDLLFYGGPIYTALAGLATVATNTTVPIAAAIIIWLAATMAREAEQ